MTDRTATNGAQPTSPTLDLALRLWPQVRDEGRVDDSDALDTLLAAQGQPGAPGYDCGLTRTFACFEPGIEATFRLPSGERPRDDEDARFIAHLLVTRTLLGAGLTVDERVTAALSTSHALSWTAVSEHGYPQTPLALAVSLWLVALDPLASSDRPLPIDWSADCFQQRDWWDPDYRLFSHYDVRERALDWTTFIAADPSRLDVCSVWTAVEPLMRIEGGARLRIALSQLAAVAEQADAGRATQQVPAAAMLDRGRVAALLQAYMRYEGTDRPGGGVRISS